MKKHFNSLSGKGISENEYQHVLKVWNKYEMKTMKECYNFYLKCDVLLLANVFEKFRKSCLLDYGFLPYSLLECTSFKLG